MAKLLLLSILIAMIGGPILAARDTDLWRGFRKVLVLTVVLNVLYLLAVRFVYPHLLP